MENTIDIEKQIKAFPPGPNWYSEYTTSVTNHYYVYATKTFLVIFTLPNFEFKSTFTASLDKINVIDTFSHFCFVAGVDPVVRIWNLLDGAQLTSFQYHKVKKREKETNSMKGKRKSSEKLKYNMIFFRFYAFRLK